MGNKKNPCICIKYLSLLPNQAYICTFFLFSCFIARLCVLYQIKTSYPSDFKTQISRSVSLSLMYMNSDREIRRFFFFRLRHTTTLLCLFIFNIYTSFPFDQRRNCWGGRERIFGLLSMTCWLQQNVQKQRFYFAANHTKKV